MKPLVTRRVSEDRPAASPGYHFAANRLFGFAINVAKHSLRGDLVANQLFELLDFEAAVNAITNRQAGPKAKLL